MNLAPTALSIVIAAALAASGAAEGQAVSNGAESSISPHRIDVRIDVLPNLPLMSVEADLTFEVTQGGETADFYLRADLDLDAIENADGLPLNYRRRRNRVRVTASSLDSGAVLTWTFRYRARFAEALEDSGQILMTTPWYPHLQQPSNPLEFQRFEPMSMRMTATLPNPWVLVSSGTNRVDEHGDGTTTYSWSDSIPSQTIPLVIGRFDQRSRQAMSGTFRSFFAPRNRSLSDSYVDYIIAAVDFFSERIGPLDRRSLNLVSIELPDSISGVTVPGMTVLESRNLGPDMTFPYRILAHEIAHHWWNHYIEIPRGRDAWLREGLPTYGSLMFLEHQYGVSMMRQELERSRRVALSIDTGEALAMGFDMETPEAIYALDYHKAAMVLHMLREVIGLDGFAQLCREMHDLDGDLTTEVFIALAGRVHGEDLSWFFDAWLVSPAVPSFRVRYGYTKMDGPSSRYELTGTIEQEGAAVRHPVLIRVPLEAAPPLEQTVWVEPGTTEFSIILPSPPRGLEFDPYGDMLHRGVSIEMIGSGRPPREEEST